LDLAAHAALAAYARRVWRAVIDHAFLYRDRVVA
jgi:hypothetical protein